MRILAFAPTPQTCQPHATTCRAQRFRVFWGVLSTFLLLPTLVFLSGCSSTNSLTLQGQVSDLQNQRVAVQNERDAWKNRYEELANSNRMQVHEIAASQQQIMTLKEEQLVLQKQLKDTLEQVATTQKQNEFLSQQIARYDDLRRQQESGTQIVSNSSESAVPEMTPPSIPGTVASFSNGQLHIEMPGDTLFEPSSGALSPKGMELVRQVGRTIATSYPGAKIDVQGHVSAFQKVSTGFPDAKAQTMSQAMSVRDVLVRENILPDQALNVSACGASSPILSSATPKGAPRNYRVELVITPARP